MHPKGRWLGRGALIAHCSSSGESLVSRSLAALTIVLHAASAESYFSFSRERLYARECIVRDFRQSRTNQNFQVIRKAAIVFSSTRTRISTA